MTHNLSPLYSDLIARSKPKDVPKATDGELKRRPIIEVVNLEKGTAFGVFGPGDLIRKSLSVLVGEHTLKKPFMRVNRLIVMHTWEAAGLAYEDFGDGVPVAGKLVFGFQIYVDEQPIFDEPIQATKDYMKYAYDTDAVVDGVGANKKVYFTSRLSFHKFMGGNEGIDLSRYDLRVEGDITVSGANLGVEEFGNEFKWAFEGWGWDR